MEACSGLARPNPDPVPASTDKCAPGSAECGEDGRRVIRREGGTLWGRGRAEWEEDQAQG